MVNRAYDFLAPALGIGVALALVVVLVFLFLGRFRKYWIIGAYVVWELLAAAAMTIADLYLHGSESMPHASQTEANRWYARLYWSTDIVDDLFRLVLVIVLIYLASAGGKRVSGRLLTGLVVLIMVLPFLLFSPNWRPVAVGSVQVPFPGAAWFQSASELLNFGAAIMNLMLWATILASKRRDPQLITVSAGLGIVVAGTAIAYGTRHLLGESQLGAVGFLFMNLAQLFGWIIWCVAFRPVLRHTNRLNPAVESAKVGQIE